MSRRSVRQPRMPARSDMKKTRIAAGVTLVVLAVLYLAFWTAAWRQSNELVGGVALSSPSELAEAMPAFSAALWMLRIDVFAASATPGEDAMAISREFHIGVIRHCWAAVAAGLAGLALLLWARPERAWFRRVLAAVSWACVAGAVLSAGVVGHSLLTHERVVPRRVYEPGTNVLNEYARSGVSVSDVEVPGGTQGVVLASSDAIADVYVEVDKRGWLAVDGAQVTRDGLSAVIAGRVAGGKPVRVLLWVDWRCRPQDRDSVVSVVTKAGAESVYFVVGHDFGTGEYRAVPQGHPVSAQRR